MNLRIQTLYALLIGALFSLSSASVFAGSAIPFSQKNFEQAQAQGQTILLHFHADWCPTCRQQKTALEALLKENGFSSLKTFQVDYDEETTLKKQLHVSSQSTLILYRGKKEQARSVAVTSKEGLREFLNKVSQ